mgnify:CR=1 FL=1
MSRKINLTPRLQMAADMVVRNERNGWLVDVGTDHAYLPAWLLQNHREQFAYVIATDLREGPLDRAIQTARNAGCYQDIDFRLCDGLAAVDTREADLIVIAGMGGDTIVHIMKNAPLSDWRGDGPMEDKVLVLQPMSSFPDLRKWLQENGFSIEEERLAREGDTLYTALLVRAGEMAPLTPAELWAGKNNHDPLRGGWLDMWAARVRRALEGMAQARGEGVSVRKHELEEVLSGLVDMKEEWELWQQ